MGCLRVVGLSLLLLLAALRCFAAQKHISVDTGECGEDTSAKETVTRSTSFTDKAHGLSAYGILTIRSSSGHSKKNQCHVAYELFVASQGGQFGRVKRLDWDTEAGEIAGIDLIGMSPDGSKFAADFWQAEGDGEEHRPVIYDVSNKQAFDLPLEDKIQKQIHSCDQNEDFVGVTNSGEAVLAVPPSVYDDSPGCGDKGVWHFDLKTGRAYRVAKVSGDKWR
jgi:hypothetical protein